MRTERPKSEEQRLLAGSSRTLCLCVLLQFAAWFGGCRKPIVQPDPVVEFSTIPPAAQGGRERVAYIAGRVSGARPGQQIVVYARSGPWWVQPWPDKPFIPIDCGSLVPALIECALFGYVKGAFTGATDSEEGLTAIAEGGTVFLDEVAALPVDLQAKLLRAIQEKEIGTVGSTRPALINVRILAATNRDLEQAVMQGTFRRDLYIHLNLLSLRIPPLRERRQDIPPLITQFLERIVRDSGQGKSFSGEALKAMMVYDWPGNVRELENCVERTCAFTSGSQIEATDLPPEIANFPSPEASNGNGHVGKIIRIAELEKQTILSAVAELNGDKLRAARLLGIGKTTLYRKLRHYASQA